MERMEGNWDAVMARGSVVYMGVWASGRHDLGDPEAVFLGAGLAV
jgi:hypothetical protein